MQGSCEVNLKYATAEWGLVQTLELFLLLPIYLIDIWKCLVGSLYLNSHHRARSVAPMLAANTCLVTKVCLPRI